MGAARMSSLSIGAVAAVACKILTNHLIVYAHYLIESVNFLCGALFLELTQGFGDVPNIKNLVTLAHPLPLWRCI